MDLFLKLHFCSDLSVFLKSMFSPTLRESLYQANFDPLIS